MISLTPLAVSHADVLRHLAEHPGDDHLAIAKATGRIASNVKRDMPRLAAEGLVGDTGAITGAGLEALRALDRAEGRDAQPADAGAAPEGYAELIWMQIDPDPLNPRKHFDEAAIEELADSIGQDGLLENLVVRPGVVPAEPFLILNGRPAPMHRLVAGERRHRAIKRLIETGRWEADAPILCKVLDVDDAGHRRLALVENLQRKDLRPIDEATALKELMAVTGQGTAEIAAEIGFTQRFVQQRLQLLDLPPALQGQVNDGAMPIEKARAALAIMPQLPPVKQGELAEGKITVDDAKEWLEDQPEPIHLDPMGWLVALELYDAIKRRPMKKASWEYASAEVGQGAKDDAALAELNRLRFFGQPSKVRDKHYTETGQLSVSIQWGAADKLDMQLNTLYRTSKEGIAAELARLRAAAGIEGEFAAGTYVTAWLNPPFDVPTAEAEAYAAALATRKEREAKEKVDRDRQKAAQATRKANAAANAEVVHQLVTELAARSGAGADPRFAEALAKAGLPAPWRVSDRAEVMAADATQVISSCWYLDDQPEVLVQRVLLAAAVNLAAGVAFTVEPAAPDEDAPDEPEADLIADEIREGAAP